VFCAFGAGQAMIVRSLMNDGRPVSALAASSARSNAATSSRYDPSSRRKSTVWVCQPYAAYRTTTSSLNAMSVSSSIEMWLSS